MKKDNKELILMLINVLMLASFIMAGFYIWLGMTAYYLNIGKINSATWLFFSPIVGYILLIIHKFAQRFLK